MVIKYKKGYNRVRNNKKEYVKAHSQGYYEGKGYPKRGGFGIRKRKPNVNRTFWTMGKRGRFTGRIPVDSGISIGDKTGIRNVEKERILGRLKSPYRNKTKILWDRHYSKYGIYPPHQNYV